MIFNFFILIMSYLCTLFIIVFIGNVILKSLNIVRMTNEEFLILSIYVGISLYLIISQYLACMKLAFPHITLSLIILIVLILTLILFLRERSELFAKMLSPILVNKMNYKLWLILLFLLSMWSLEPLSTKPLLVCDPWTWLANALHVNVFGYDMFKKYSMLMYTQGYAYFLSLFITTSPLRPIYTVHLLPPLIGILSLCGVYLLIRLVLNNDALSLITLLVVGSTRMIFGYMEIAVPTSLCIGYLSVYIYQLLISMKRKSFGEYAILSIIIIGFWLIHNLIALIYVSIISILVFILLEIKREYYRRYFIKYYLAVLIFVIIILFPINLYKFLQQNVVISNIKWVEKYSYVTKLSSWIEKILFFCSNFPPFVLIISMISSCYVAINFKRQKIEALLIDILYILSLIFILVPNNFILLLLPYTRFITFAGIFGSLISFYLIEKIKIRKRFLEICILILLIVTLPYLILTLNNMQGWHYEYIKPLTMLNNTLPRNINVLVFNARIVHEARYFLFPRKIITGTTFSYYINISHIDDIINGFKKYRIDCIIAEENRNYDITLAAYLINYIVLPYQNLLIAINKSLLSNLAMIKINMHERRLWTISEGQGIISLKSYKHSSERILCAIGHSNYYRRFTLRYVLNSPINILNNNIMSLLVMSNHTRILITFYDSKGNWVQWRYRINANYFNLITIDLTKPHETSKNVFNFKKVKRILISCETDKPFASSALYIYKIIIYQNLFKYGGI